MTVGATGVVGTIRGAPRARAAASTSLGPAPLPAPILGSASDLQDAVLLLMRADIQQGAADRQIGQVQLRNSRAATATTLKKKLDALAEERQAEKESHGFWASLKKSAGTIAKIAAVVACAAGAVFTGGATLVGIAAIVALGFSASAMVVRETQLFGKSSEDIAFGLNVTAAVVGIAACGAGLLNAGEQAAAMTSTQLAAKAVQTGAQGASGISAGTAVVAGCYVAGYQHDAERAAADVEDARGKMELQARDRQMIIAWLEQVSGFESDAKKTAVRTIEECSKPTDIAINGVKG